MTDNNNARPYVLALRPNVSRRHADAIVRVERDGKMHSRTFRVLSERGFVIGERTTGPRGGRRFVVRLTPLGKWTRDRLADLCEGVDGDGRYLYPVDRLPSGVPDGQPCDDFGNPRCDYCKGSALEGSTVVPASVANGAESRKNVVACRSCIEGAKLFGTDIRERSAFDAASNVDEIADGAIDVAISLGFARIAVADVRRLASEFGIDVPSAKAAAALRRAVKAYTVRAIAGESNVFEPTGAR